VIELAAFEKVFQGHVNASITIPHGTHGRGLAHRGVGIVKSADHRLLGLPAILQA
jgi:hypothetical protein